MIKGSSPIIQGSSLTIDSWQWIIKELSLTIVGGLCNQELRFPNKERSSPDNKGWLLTIQRSLLTFQASPFKPREMSPASLPTYLPITFTPSPHSPKSTSREQSEVRGQ